MACSAGYEVLRPGSVLDSRAPPFRRNGRSLRPPRAGRNVAAMNYRNLGSSDLEISEISLGSWLTYSGGVALEQARACTDAAFDAGINFFDTANVYGRGAAETAWGE